MPWRSPSLASSRPPRAAAQLLIRAQRTDCLAVRLPPFSLKLSDLPLSVLSPLLLHQHPGGATRMVGVLRAVAFLRRHMRSRCFAGLEPLTATPPIDVSFVPRLH